MAKKYEWNIIYDRDTRKSGGIAAAFKKLATQAEDDGWEVHQMVMISETILGVVIKKPRGKQILP